LSDVDLAADIARNATFDALDLERVLMDLTEALGRRIELVERRSMSPEFAARVALGIILIF